MTASYEEFFLLIKLKQTVPCIKYHLTYHEKTCLRGPNSEDIDHSVTCSVWYEAKAFPVWNSRLQRSLIAQQKPWLDCTNAIACRIYNRKPSSRRWANSAIEEISVLFRIFSLNKSLLSHISWVSTFENKQIVRKWGNNRLKGPTDWH